MSKKAPAEEVIPLENSKKAIEETDKSLIKKAEEFLKSPNLLEQISEHISSIGVTGEKEFALSLYFTGTSRLLSKPLAAQVMGSSSSGKSYVIKQVSSLFPEEAVFHAHRMSTRALEYMEKGSLIHRFVVAGERSQRKDEDAAEVTRNLREMISDGRLSAAVVGKSSDGGHETTHIEQEGPIAYVESTTMQLREIFNEDRTRFILFSTDETTDQTEAVMSDMAANAANPQSRPIKR